MLRPVSQRNEPNIGFKFADQYHVGASAVLNNGASHKEPGAPDSRPRGRWHPADKRKLNRLIETCDHQVIAVS